MFMGRSSLNVEIWNNKIAWNVTIFMQYFDLLRSRTKLYCFFYEFSFWNPFEFKLQEILVSIKKITFIFNLQIKIFRNKLFLDNFYCSNPIKPQIGLPIFSFEISLCQPVFEYSIPLITVNLPSILSQICIQVDLSNFLILWTLPSHANSKKRRNQWKLCGRTLPKLPIAPWHGKSENASTKLVHTCSPLFSGVPHYLRSQWIGMHLCNK